MTPTIRQTADGIELFDGDNQSFRAWPLTWDEAKELYRRLGAVMIRRMFDEDEQQKEAGK